MKNFKQLTENGLSMFKKAISNLEQASQMMLSKELYNTDVIEELEKENTELVESRIKNNKIVENIKNIID